MGNTFHNIPTLEAYEQCDFVEIGKEIFDKIQRNAFPIQNYKVYKFQKKVDIYNEKTGNKMMVFHLENATAVDIAVMGEGESLI